LNPACASARPANLDWRPRPGIKPGMEGFALLPRSPFATRRNQNHIACVDLERIGVPRQRDDTINTKNGGALRITPSWRRFAGLDRRARLAHERDGPFEGVFSFAQSLISPRFSTS
jgi:hypothetical protein